MKKNILFVLAFATFAKFAFAGTFRKPAQEQVEAPAVPESLKKYPSTVSKSMQKASATFGDSYCKNLAMLSRQNASNTKAKDYVKSESKISSVVCKSESTAASPYVGFPNLPKPEVDLVNMIAGQELAKLSLAYLQDSGMMSDMDYFQDLAGLSQGLQLFTPEKMLAGVSLPENYIDSWRDYTQQLIEYYRNH